MQCELCVQMLAQPCSRLMGALVGQHSASPAAALWPRLAVLPVRSMRWIDFSWQSRLRLPSRQAVVPCSVCQVCPPLKPPAWMLCSGHGCSHSARLRDHLDSYFKNSALESTLKDFCAQASWCSRPVIVLLWLCQSPGRAPAGQCCPELGTLCGSASLTAGGWNPCIT